MAVSEVPMDYFGETLARHEIALVRVSLGTEPTSLPPAISIEALREFPQVCSYYLELDD
jgi:hypothetical protein